METRSASLVELNKQVEEHRAHTDTLFTDLRSELDGKFSSFQERFSGLEAVILKHFTHGPTPSPAQDGSPSPSLSASLLSTPEVTRPPDPPDTTPHRDPLLPNGMSSCLTKVELKVRLACLHLEGKALQWHHNFIKNRYDIFPSWPEYVRELYARFCKMFDNPLSELMKVKQAGVSIEVYLENFDCALTRLSLPTPHALSIFLTNMNEHLALNVRKFKVDSISEAARIAKLHESSLVCTLVRQPRAPFNPYPKQNHHQFNKPAHSTPLLPSPNQTVTNTTQPSKPSFIPRHNGDNPPRRFTFEEMKARKSQGLCMFCDDVFTPGHQLKHKRAQLFMIDCEDYSDDEEELTEVVVEESAPSAMGKAPTISLNALNSSTSFNCMRVTGQYGNKKRLYVLIDPRSTHNFLDIGVGCLLQPISPMAAAVDGGNLITKYICRDFNMKTLVPILWDFLNLKMELTFQGIKHLLKGVTKAGCKMINGGSLNKILQKGPHIAMLQIRELGTDDTEQKSLLSHISTSNTKSSLTTAVQSLIDQYDDLFITPTELPPFREGFDHQIPLETGANPLNLRPYRGLNKQTVKDKYPHPITRGLTGRVMQITVLLQVGFACRFSSVADVTS
ncbi:unnamed protein product [Microthlaspi erraticum]|uniref:Ty3 transposon capsid-like protein domain-containing protein n=1 Tax=Microthlaspi erraticum TaxID=1685480 RepID=A0A6D2IXR7_9BRAS|nr:unnamed protein product [Microthlaspi erraticum]